MTTQNFDNELVARAFFYQVTPDIQKYFKEHMAGWQGGDITKTRNFMVMFMCNVFMFDGWEEIHRPELAKENKQEKQTRG